jgi:hypothetical protein
VRRASSTVVALVGEGAHDATAAVGRAANVHAIVTGETDDALTRAVAAWDEAARTHVPYAVHDADPLATVADAWVRRFDETGPAGELEVAVSATLARWRARSLELPDYYLVLDAEALPPTRRHWFLGVLHGAAPARVVPVPGEPAMVRDALGGLGAGRWWPELDHMLDGIDRVVPNRAGRTPASRAPAR